MGGYRNQKQDQIIELAQVTDLAVISADKWEIIKLAFEPVTNAMQCIQDP